MKARISRRSILLVELFTILGVVVTGAQSAEFVLQAVAGEPPANEAFESPIPTPAEVVQTGQRSRTPGQAGTGVYKDRITPHWFADNARFWYRNDLSGGKREFILVDAHLGSRQPAFDHAKLAGGLSKATGTEYSDTRLPFDSIEFVEDSTAIVFKAGDTTWKCDLDSYACTQTDRAADKPITPAPEHPQRGQRGGPFAQRRAGQGQPDRSPRSPDGKWTALIKDHNVWVRSEPDGTELELSQQGREGLAFGMLQWSPDSKTLVAFRIESGERKEVHLIQSSPPSGGRAVFQSRPYALPGDKFNAYELNLFQLDDSAPPENGVQPKWRTIKPDVDRVDFGTPRIRWKPDGNSFCFSKTDRGHQRFRVIEIDTHTGQARTLIDERNDTFIWTAHTENVRLETVNYLQRTDEIIYVSERDGWRHLYLIDAAPSPPTPLPACGERGRGEGQQITKGEWVVRGIDRIDEENCQIWFHGSGKNAGQDPYLIHFYRINFDGTGLVALTAGDGNHTIQFSPDGKYIIDTYSRVDMAPVHELRGSSDGKLICELDISDISELVERGWEPPEVFVAKGRDGTTDICGIICRPRNFDPTKKYPVIEDIYAGPQGSFVPKTFSPQRRYASLTDLGFIVAKIDGMGTANRSKAFHDVCWKNLKDAGLPDRILWHRAVAAKYAWYDTSRVGIYGTSAGGQNAAGAVLFHPEFYRAAVASCGCHDNRMDKASWNEQWMGYPVGPQYSESSNIDNAHRLRGKLFLIVGEMDTNVPPESTMRFADALIKAGKDFDLLVVPSGGHGSGGAYGQRRMQDFFVRHLLGAEPPDRNASGTKTGAE